MRTSRGETPYQCVLLEDFFALFGQLYWEHGHFPSSLASSNLDTSGAPNDLMSKADTNNANTILLKELFGKLNQFQNPRVVVKGIVLLHGVSTRLAV